MSWTCPNCQLHLSEPVHPVRCHCGTVTDKDGKTVSRGLGDKIAKATKLIGIKPCGGCKQRQSTLNRVFPNKSQRADVLILVPTGASSSFTDTRGTLLGEKLKQLKLTTVVHGLNASGSKQISELVASIRPQLVINQAMVLSSKRISELTGQHRRTKWLTINHSSFADMIRVKNWLPQHVEFLALARDNSRCFYAHVDDRKYFERLNVPRAFHLPNCIRIPKSSATRELGDPLALSLVCRPDPLKNLPSQLIAAAAIEKATVLLSTSHDIEPQLGGFIRSLGLSLTQSPWQTWQQYIDWIAGQVDIGLQVSFTESMNYVALEHMLLGKPVCGSPAVRYLPQRWQAQPDDPDAIASVIRELRDDYSAQSVLAQSVASEFAERNNAGFVRIIEKRVL